MIKRMEKEFLSGRVAMFSRENIWMMKGKDMGKCIGLMEVFTKGSGITVYRMV